MRVWMGKWATPGRRKSYKLCLSIGVNMESKTNPWLRLYCGLMSDALSDVATATISLRPSADYPTRNEYFVQLFKDDFQSQAKDGGSYQSLQDLFDIAFKGRLTKAAKLRIKNFLDAGLEGRSILAEDYKANSVMRRVLITSLCRVAQRHQRHVSTLQVPAHR